MIIGISESNSKTYIQLLNDNGEIISTYNSEFPILNWKISKSKNYLMVYCEEIDNENENMRFLYIYKLNIEKYRIEFFSKIECKNTLLLYDLSPNDKYLALLNEDKIITIFYFLSHLVDGLYDNSSKIYLEDDMYGGYAGEYDDILEFSPDSSLLITTINVNEIADGNIADNSYFGTISIIFNTNDDFRISEIFRGKILKFLDNSSIFYVYGYGTPTVLKSTTLPFNNEILIYDINNTVKSNNICMNENKDILIYKSKNTLTIQHIKLLTTVSLAIKSKIYSFIIINNNEIILLADNFINKITLKNGVIKSIEKIVQLPTGKNITFTSQSLKLFGL